MRARSIITRMRGVTGFMAGHRNRSRLCRLVGMLQVAGLSCLGPAALQAASIRAHPANPHYFEFRGQPTLLITSAEHYGAVINSGFDWERYLQTLARDGMNYTREFTSNLDVLRMKPAPEITSRPLPGGMFARALVKPGRTCWIYLHHSRHRKYGTFVTGYEAQPGTHRDSLELALPPGHYRVQWFRPRDGTLLREDRVKHEGAKLRLASPDYDDADITVVIRSEATTATVSIEPGTDIQAVVDANPAGTTFRDNVRGGIFHEIGYEATIRHSLARRNGTGRHYPSWTPSDTSASAGSGRDTKAESRSTT